MARNTTTSRINAALSMLQITKAECYSKSTYQTETLDNDTFIENLQFLNESGALADCIGWTFEKNYKADGEYIFETGRKNPATDYIVSAYFRMRDGVKVDGLEEMLLAVEEMEG